MLSEWSHLYGLKYVAWLHVCKAVIIWLLVFKHLYQVLFVVVGCCECFEKYTVYSEENHSDAKKGTRNYLTFLDCE